MSRVHFDPATYGDLMRREVPSYQVAWLAESGFEARVTWSGRDLVVGRADLRSAATG